MVVHVTCEPHERSTRRIEPTVDNPLRWCHGHSVDWVADKQCDLVYVPIVARKTAFEMRGDPDASDVGHWKWRCRKSQLNCMRLTIPPSATLIQVAGDRASSYKHQSRFCVVI